MTAPSAAGYRYSPGGLAARRFPLAPRPKPPCRPLTERLARPAEVIEKLGLWKRVPPADQNGTLW